MDLESIKNEVELNARRFQAAEEKLLDSLTVDQRTEIGYPVKSIVTLDRFTANKKKYVIRQSLAIERFEIFENLQADVGFGVAFKDVFANLLDAYNSCNEGRIADAAVKLHNTMNGIKSNLEGRTNPVLLLCALFICREDEDATTYDAELTKSKIDDWRIEGIAMESFFTLAFNLVHGFIPVLKTVSGDISETMKAVTKNLDIKDVDIDTLL